MINSWSLAQQLYFPGGLKKLARKLVGQETPFTRRFKPGTKGIELREYS